MDAVAIRRHRLALDSHAEAGRRRASGRRKTSTGYGSRHLAAIRKSQVVRRVVERAERLAAGPPGRRSSTATVGVGVRDGEGASVSVCVGVAGGALSVAVGVADEACVAVAVGAGVALSDGLGVADAVLVVVALFVGLAGAVALAVGDAGDVLIGVG